MVIWNNQPYDSPEAARLSPRGLRAPSFGYPCSEVWGRNPKMEDIRSVVTREQRERIVTLVKVIYHKKPWKPRFWVGKVKDHIFVYSQKACKGYINPKFLAQTFEKVCDINLSQTPRRHATARTNEYKFTYFNLQTLITNLSCYNLHVGYNFKYPIP